MAKSSSKILIAGGGIGGLALGVALQKFGVTAVVWERSRKIREIGAGLLLTPNAVWVLQQLGLFEQTCRLGRLVEIWQIMNKRGKVLQTFRRTRGGFPSISITRSAFQNLLYSNLPPGAVSLNHEVAAWIAGRPDQPASVLSIHGDIFAADVIVGADGGHSVIRKAFKDQGSPRILPYVGWRGLVDGVPSEWKDGRISESWGEGGRFGIAPVSEGRTYWYATENTKPDWNTPRAEWKPHLLARFRDWHSPIRDLIAATKEDEILLSDIREQPPLPSWSRGLVTLLGDAAHLMTPNLGQGAAMALEDAWVLAKCLKRHGCNPAALNEYESLRGHRASFIVWQSRQVGRLIQIEHPALMAMRDRVLQLTPDWIGSLALAPVFNFRA